jgi:hypothetical protein
MESSATKKVTCRKKDGARDYHFNGNKPDSVKQTLHGFFIICGI